MIQCMLEIHYYQGTVFFLEKMLFRLFNPLVSFQCSEKVDFFCVCGNGD
jgi:hypothetical protein